jgi:hypothetical protein
VPQATIRRLFTYAGASDAPASRIRKSGEEILAGATGLEPATFGVTGRQFNLNIQDAFQLSTRRNEPKHPDQLEREARLTSGKKRALGAGGQLDRALDCRRPCECHRAVAPAVRA